MLSGDSVTIQAPITRVYSSCVMNRSLGIWGPALHFNGWLAPRGADPPSHIVNPVVSQIDTVTGLGRSRASLTNSTELAE